MKISQKGIDLIKSFEGLRLKAYKPVSTEKYYTIGYGHYGEDVKQGMIITKEEAERLLRKDLERFEAGVNFALRNKELKQQKFDVLVSFAYNVGLGNLGRSSLLKKVLVNPTDVTIRDEFMKWVYSGKTKLKGLERRRKAEADLYFS